MSKDRQKCVVALKTVNHYSRLPNSKLIQKFVQNLNQKIDLTSSRSCFLVVQSITDAFLLLCFCFGRPAFLEKLSKNRQMSQQAINQLNYMSKTLQWSDSAFQIFQKNAQIFGRSYPIYFKEILPKIKPQQAQKYFRLFTKNELLYGVKIRLWSQNQEEISKFKDYARENETKQAGMNGDLKYLVISKDKNNSCNVGMIQVLKISELSDSFYTVSNNFRQSIIQNYQKSFYYPATSQQSQKQIYQQVSQQQHSQKNIQKQVTPGQAQNQVKKQPLNQIKIQIKNQRRRQKSIIQTNCKSCMCYII